MIGVALPQSTNHLWWVAAGILGWCGAYFDLATIDADSIGEVIFITLGSLPFAAALVFADISRLRWHKKPSQAHVFGGLAIVMLIVGLALYALNSKIQAAFRKRVRQHSGSLLSGLGAWIAVLVSALFGATLVLGSAAALIVGGWQLIQGSVSLGLILTGTAAVVAVLCRRPDAPWNYLHKCYDVLKPAGAA